MGKVVDVSRLILLCTIYKDIELLNFNSSAQRHFINQEKAGPKIFSTFSPTELMSIDGNILIPALSHQQLRSVVKVIVIFYWLDKTLIGETKDRGASKPLVAVFFLLSTHLNIEANPNTAKKYHLKVIQPIVSNGVMRFRLKFVSNKIEDNWYDTN